MYLRSAAAVGTCLSCSHGGFRHNEIRDITASHLSKQLNLTSSLSQQKAFACLLQTRMMLLELILLLMAFWTNSTRAFFDIRLFNSHTQSNANLSPTAAYRVKSPVPIYEQRICEIEHGSFIPLIFSAIYRARFLEILVLLDSKNVDSVLEVSG